MRDFVEAGFDVSLYDPLVIPGREEAHPGHPGRAGTLVSPHPIPRHQQEGGIGDEVKQIVEPAMRIITSPTVQLGLDLQYPKLGAHQRRLQFVGIHRRQPPGIPVSVLLTCWPPSPLRPGFPGLQRRGVTPATTTGPPSPPWPSVGNGPAHHRPGWTVGGRPRRVPTFTTQSIGQGGAQLYSGSIATATPQTFTVASPPVAI